MQISMNVRVTLVLVMRMPGALTLLALTPVPATLDSKEMDIFAEVKNSIGTIESVCNIE